MQKWVRLGKITLKWTKITKKYAKMGRNGQNNVQL